MTEPTNTAHVIDDPATAARSVSTSTVRRRQRSDLIKLITFLAVMGVLTVYLFLVMGDVRPGDRTSYRASFDDVSGLKPGDQVRVASVAVGTVKTIDINADATVDVTFDIKSDIPMSTATSATVTYKNLVGDRYLALKRSSTDAPKLPAGGLIPASRTEAALDLDTLLNGFKPLFVGLNPQQINKLSVQLVDVLQGQTGAIRQLLASVASVTSTIGDREELVGQVVRNLNTVVGEVDTHRDGLDTLVAGLSDLVSGLEKQDTQVLDAASQISDFSEQATDVLQRARGDLTPTLKSLQEASRGLNQQEGNLREVLDQLPKHYDTLSQTSSYGSFFNFFLCGVRLQLTDDANGTPIATPWINSDLERCK